MNARVVAGGIVIVLFGLSLSGCTERAADGPPTVRLGDTLCDECNMILSDSRFATSTIVDGPRGPEPRFFDDFICQVHYETEHDDLRVLRRWSHNYTNSEWIDTDTAHFIVSPRLQAPMASNTAAVATADEAQHVQSTLGGDIVTFAAAWERLKPENAPPTQKPGTATPPTAPAAEEEPSTKPDS